jgi:porin
MNRFLPLFAALSLFALPLHAEENTKLAHEEEVHKEGETLWGREQLTGDWGGVRTHLADSGLTLGANEVLDTYGVVAGGVRQRAEVVGRLELDLDTDFDKIFGLKGLTGHASALQIHGRGLGSSALNGNIMAPSNIEAERAFRLFTLWLEQSLFDDNASLRFGQLAADDEFATSEYGGLFLNASLGWPGAFAADLPNGGPAYPYATPGIRLKVGKDKPWSVMAAIFNGDPAPGVLSAQDNSPSGTEFNLDSDALMMLEGAYTRDGGENGLSGTYKLGFWYHTGHFGDLLMDDTGVSLAAPGSSGNPRNAGRNYGVYAIADQQVWKGADDKAVGAFVKGFLQPDDRNLVFWQGDVGVNAKGFFGRKDDTIGLAFSYGAISNRARQLDEDTNAVSATNGPLRDFEAALELTYQAQITPWLVLQPDFQYIFHPGGNVADPTDVSGTTPVQDAAVIGVRTAITF